MAQQANVSVPKRRIIVINGSGGAFVTISASSFCRYVEIQECPPENPPSGSNFDGTNYAPQGLNYTLPDDSFTQKYALNNGDLLTFGDRNYPRKRAVGQPGWTQPDASAVAATVLAKLKSATVTATQVEIREWP